MRGKIVRSSDKRGMNWPASKNLQTLFFVRQNQKATYKTAPNFEKNWKNLKVITEVGKVRAWKV